MVSLAGLAGMPLGAVAALAVHVALSAATVAVIIAIAALVRERRTDVVADIVYESGVSPAPATRGPLEVPYFLVAALFVIVDMEAAILFSWAVAARETGWPGLVEAAIFIVVLLAALAWLWVDGALDWVRKPPGTRARGDAGQPQVSSPPRGGGSGAARPWEHS